MKSIEINNQKNGIIERKEALTKELDAVKGELTQLQTECPHELVLVFDDHFPHLIGPIKRCKCPACGKREDIHPSHSFAESSFKDSKRIDLTEYDFAALGFTSGNDVYQPIVDNIFANYAYYYESGTPIAEITASVKKIVDETLKDYKPVKQIGRNPFIFKSND